MGWNWNYQWGAPKEEFVSRVEAFKRAQWANQIPRWKEPAELFSEMLW